MIRSTPPATTPDTTGGPEARGAGPAAFSMESYRGCRRPLLLFAASPKDPDFRRQKDLLDAAAVRAAERDVVVIQVFAGAQASVDGVAIGSAAVRDLCDAFGPCDGSPLTVVLLGKDGTEKLRQTGVVDPTQLFDLIDSMPMR